MFSCVLPASPFHVSGSCHSCESWPRGVGGAQISHSLAFILSVAAEPHHNGFGPFRQFLINTSWEAAKGLKLIGLGEKVEVHVRELPVSYLKTQKIIGELWHTLNPKFAVHLGLARGSSVVILEQTGKNTGYKDRDVCGYCPETRCCIEGGPQKLESVINMRVVSKHFRQAGMDVVYSRDAGRYLCDFAYYCSLYHSQGRAALIHVPTSGILASADRLVPLLQALIQKILEQLEEHSKPIDPPFVSMRSTEVTEPAALL
ncbi:pyroglutamyl-peptidase 1 isoform X4 [Oreochromis aureus]|nr:pyroglutamyl-peptidase 1 isoform X4 [Oreochromis aureus]